VFERNGRRVAVFGYNGFPPRSFAATTHKPGTAWLVEKNVIRDIQSAKAQGHADMVLLYLHWGEELEEQPNEAQIGLAHRLVDAGADAIIGGHPHVIQTIEWYRERPIVYSLGNFVFDYFPHDPPIWTGHILRLDYLDGPVPKLSTIGVELDASGVPHLVASH
jgi:poly-gamma-glutamate synthesis protein (capsule biosynthesis protein)